MNVNANQFFLEYMHNNLIVIIVNLLILLLFVRSFWLKSRDFVKNIRIEQFSIVELSKLVYIYLTGETTINGKDFSLAKPHCASHARCRGASCTSPSSSSGPRQIKWTTPRVSSRRSSSWLSTQLSTTAPGQDSP